MDSLSSTLMLVGTFIVGATFYYKWIFQYWQRRNIPSADVNKSAGLFLGIFLQKESFASSFRKYYEYAKAAGYKDYGLYQLWTPVYVPINPYIIKNILAVDFSTFIDRGVYYNKEKDPLSAHIFSIKGQEWRDLRAKLSPTFTSGKMKMMIHTVVECAEQLENAIDKESSTKNPFNVRVLSGQFTANVIGSVAFGLNCNSFENPNSDFITYSNKVLQGSIKGMIKNLLSMIVPDICLKMGMRVNDPEASEFFLKTVKNSIDYRKRNNVERNDFMQLLINLQNKQLSEGTPEITLEEIAAQAFVFFLAGYETSSSTMSFCLYELSLNPDIQSKVRTEIENVLKKHDGKVTYEALVEMKYLGQTIDETLRKYPPVPVLFRKNITDYELPGSGSVLEKNTTVSIPVIGLHYDSEYYPDPEKFDPDRFSEENKQNRIPYTYLPFGEGPRNCLGLRFGIMQAKVGLIHMLRRYKFSLDSKTQTPLQMDQTVLILSVVGGIWLNASKAT